MLKESDKDVHAADWLDVHYWPLDMEDLLMQMQRGVMK